MRKSKFMLLLVAVVASFMMSSCSKVPTGNVGIKVYLLGGSKGVDNEVLGTGRYWIGVNEELYLFPTFTQNYVWTASEDEGSTSNESIDFQDVDGLKLNADVGITYHLEESKIADLFQKYKKGIKEITDIYLRNMVRDAIVQHSGGLKVDYIYGAGKTELITKVQETVAKQCVDRGIMIDKIYWIGAIRLPQTVESSINAKIQATQKAIEIENKVREENAQAEIKLVQAKAEAESKLIRAEAEAKANRVLSASITPTLVEYKKIEKWNGIQPTVTGANAIINLK